MLEPLSDLMIPVGFSRGAQEVAWRGLRTLGFLEMPLI
jgi:hypothetical protein